MTSYLLERPTGTLMVIGLLGLVTVARRRKHFEAGLMT
jgi:hypothetical protein